MRVQEPFQVETQRYIINKPDSFLLAGVEQATGEEEMISTKMGQ